MKTRLLVSTLLVYKPKHGHYYFYQSFDAYKQSFCYEVNTLTSAANDCEEGITATYLLLYCS